MRIILVFFITISHLTGRKFAICPARPVWTSYFLCQISGIKLIIHVWHADQQAYVISERIIMIIHRNKTHIKEWEHSFNIASCLYIISSKSRKIFNNNTVNISLFDLLHHLIKTISLKISSGFRYIIIFLCNHDIFLFFYEIMKQNHLRFYRISFSVLFTLIGKPCIKGCMWNFFTLVFSFCNQIFFISNIHIIYFSWFSSHLYDLPLLNFYSSVHTCVDITSHWLYLP